MSRWWMYGAGVVLALVFAVGAAAYWTLFRPVKLTKPEMVEIRPNTSFGYVARRLEERKLIPSALAFKVYGRVTGLAGQLKVGEYEVTGRQTPVGILKLLVSGHVKSYRLTIPEGKWASEIDGLLAPFWPDAAGQFVRLTKEPRYWQGKVPFPLEGKTLEGYLYPDTYHLARGLGAEKIIGAMLGSFQKTCWAAYQAHRQGDPSDKRSLQEVLVLASLVEGEAKVDSERPVIAGVYMNRLEKGMLLQCDATVLYARGERLKRVLFRDLEIDSSYNTYRFPGLPPGPINNPGLASFKAALNPAKVPYLYYVAKGDGSHVFSRTMAEHSAAIQRVRGK